jgi:CheY-like chemotaxis protein
MVRRILAVDDNEVVGWTLRARLWAAGYEATTVSNAVDAYAALRVGRFDLVLLDLEMPGIGGLDALAAFDRLGLRRETPVLLLTASDELRHMRKARQLGAIGYLTKAHANRTLVQYLDRLFVMPETTWLDDHTWVYPQPTTPSEAEPTAPTLAFTLAQETNRPGVHR